MGSGPLRMAMRLIFLRFFPINMPTECPLEAANDVNHVTGRQSLQPGALITKATEGANIQRIPAVGGIESRIRKAVGEAFLRRCWDRPGR
jgi:hypothetical protein